jgi:hypothetical protein
VSIRLEQKKLNFCRTLRERNGKEQREHVNRNKCKEDNDKNKDSWWLMLLAHVCRVACPASCWFAKRSTLITMFWLHDAKVAQLDGLQATEFASRLLVFAFFQTDLLVYAFGQCDMEALP